MALSKKDRQEIAEMISRSIGAVGYDDARDIETIAQTPMMRLFVRIRHLTITTMPKEYAPEALQADAKRIVKVTVEGVISSEGPGSQDFFFPPNDGAMLSEFVRYQSFERRQGRQLHLKYLVSENDPFAATITQVWIRSQHSPQSSLSKPKPEPDIHDDEAIDLE